MKKFLVLAIIALTFSIAHADVPTDRGPLVSMELRNIEIKDVLRALGQEHGINIVVDDSVAGKVTVSLRDVPLWDALDSILISKGYTYRLQPGGVLVVEPVLEVNKTEKRMSVRDFKLKYLVVTDGVSGMVKGVLTNNGNVTEVRSSNSIIVKDLPVGIERAEELLKQLDVRPRQVMIEARIVEINTSYSRDLGVQWGKTGYTDASNAYGTGKPGFGQFEVNLPKTSPLGMDLLFGVATDTFSLNLTLSALEDTGAGKIISQPKIMVLDNEEAEITSGTEILIPTLVNATVAGTLTREAVEPQILTAKLELTVTPRVVDDEQIVLSVDTKREEFDFGSEIQGFPPKLSRTAKTQFMVKNGQTVAIGGIYTKNESTDESRAPILGKIPILGWLFKSESKRDSQSELLIFITPTIATEETVQWSEQTR